MHVKINLYSYTANKYVCTCTAKSNKNNMYDDVYSSLTCSNEHTEECLPDIMWCREPFMEELNEIEALNDISN